MYSLLNSGTFAPALGWFSKILTESNNSSTVIVAYFRESLPINSPIISRSSNALSVQTTLTIYLTFSLLPHLNIHDHFRNLPIPAELFQQKLYGQLPDLLLSFRVAYQKCLLGVF